MQFPRWWSPVLQRLITAFGFGPQWTLTNVRWHLYVWSPHTQSLAIQLSNSGGNTWHSWAKPCLRLVDYENKGIIRPPDIVCRRTYILQVFLSFFLFLFAAEFPRSLNGTQRKSATWSEVSVIWKHMSEIWDIPSPYKSKAKNHLFWTTSQLNGNFNGLYLRNEIWYKQSGKCVANYKVCPTSSQNNMNFGPQTVSNWKWVSTHPP